MRNPADVRSIKYLQGFDGFIDQAIFALLHYYDLVAIHGYFYLSNLQPMISNIWF